MIVDAPVPESNRSIVIGFDGSLCSIAAFRWTCAHLVKSGDTIIIAEAVSSSDITKYDLEAFSIVGVVELDEESMAKANHLIHELVNDLRSITPPNVQFRTFIKIGDAREVILEAIKNSNASLAVVGSHGKSELKGLFLGSVSNFLITNSPVPVMVYRDPKVKN